mgnify:CR=1 FL=1
MVELPGGTLKLCKVRVWRKDWPRPAVGVAYWSEYVQTIRDRQTSKERPAAMWAKMPHVMLAKCAESLALRKATAAIAKALLDDPVQLLSGEREAELIAPAAGSRARAGGRPGASPPGS